MTILLILSCLIFAKDLPVKFELDKNLVSVKEVKPTTPVFGKSNDFKVESSLVVPEKQSTKSNSLKDKEKRDPNSVSENIDSVLPIESVEFSHDK